MAVRDRTESDGVARPVERRERQGGHVAEMQRRRLLLAIGELVGEAGIEGASVGRICKRAGVSRRTFYDLFDDREACLLAAFDQAIERLRQVVVESGADEKTWLERVRLALAALLGQLDDDRGLARLCVVETLRAGPAVLERRRAVLERLAVALDEGRGQGGGQPPPLTAESTVGGVVAVVHARVIASLSAGAAKPVPTVKPAHVNRDGSLRGDAGSASLADLAGSLMSMIAHPYLGPAAARQELARKVTGRTRATRTDSRSDGRALALPPPYPFKELRIRVTFRTVRVLAAVAARPGASNREIGREAGVADQGQMSKLLRRLEAAGLVENAGGGGLRGESNAWRLTDRGAGLLDAVGDPIAAEA